MLYYVDDLQSEDVYIVVESLTPSMEDYLETILQLSKENGVAKISDIARSMKIAKPSVTQAVALLRRDGLVTQTPYGPISLTEAGREKAQEVWHRHQVISRFLFDILKVPSDVANKDACLIEHIISPETIARMDAWLEPTMPALVSLDKLRVGQKGQVVSIEGRNNPIRQRILEMGLVPGAEITVERMAPLGFPIEISLRDFHLSLRQEEASRILIRVGE